MKNGLGVTRHDILGLSIGKPWLIMKAHASGPNVSFNETNTIEYEYAACSVITHSGQLSLYMPTNVCGVGCKPRRIKPEPKLRALVRTSLYLNQLYGLDRLFLNPRQYPFPVQQLRNQVSDTRFAPVPHRMSRAAGAYLWWCLPDTLAPFRNVSYNVFASSDR